MNPWISTSWATDTHRAVNTWLSANSWFVANAWAITIFWALLLNCLTCTIVRFLWAGRLIEVTPNPTTYHSASTTNRSTAKSSHPRIYLISGLKSQPDKSYAKIDFAGYNRVLLKFSLLGYNPVLATPSCATFHPYSHLPAFRSLTFPIIFR